MPHTDQTGHQWLRVKDKDIWDFPGVVRKVCLHCSYVKPEWLDIRRKEVQEHATQLGHQVDRVGNVYFLDGQDCKLGYFVRDDWLKDWTARKQEILEKTRIREETIAKARERGKTANAQ